MPYDDSNIKKMIKYQTERKVGFSRNAKIVSECKDLVHWMLEADVKQRATVDDVQHSTWLFRGRRKRQADAAAKEKSLSSLEKTALKKEEVAT